MRNIGSNNNEKIITIVASATKTTKISAGRLCRHDSIPVHYHLSRRDTGYGRRDTVRRCAINDTFVRQVSGIKSGSV